MIEPDTIKLLRECDAGKDPNPMAKGMSWIKTNMTLAVGESDSSIANLITDGCSMGVKSLNRYLKSVQSGGRTVKRYYKASEPSGRKSGGGSSPVSVKDSVRCREAAAG